MSSLYNVHNEWALTWCTQGRWPGIEQMGQSTPACSTQQVSSQWVSSRHLTTWDMVIVSVPDPDPPDPHVFGPPESGSGSFYHQAKIVSKTLIPTVLWLFLDFSSLKNDVNVPLKKVINRKTFFYLFFVGVFKVNDENSRSWIRIRIRIRIHTKMAWIRNTGHNKGTVVREAGHSDRTRDTSPTKHCRFDTITYL